MLFHAIRRKKDGVFLPAVIGRRGSTQAEPTPDAPPRLFMRARDAKRALEWWAEGVWICHRSGGRNDWTGEYDYDEELHVEKSPDRKVEDFEVVQLEVLVKTEI